MYLITLPIKQAFHGRFSGDPQFSLRGNGTVVTLGVGTIDIAVGDPLQDIAIKLGVQGGGHPVLVLSRGVSLNVSWSFLEHVPSLGCTEYQPRYTIRHLG